MQIEARIDQDADISKEMTLWGQKGSRVIRGDLLVIPIEQSIAYVEPVYLQATKGELPQLKRVIVAHGDQIVMGSTLNESLSHVFGGRVALEAAPRVEKVAGLKSLVGDALNALRAAKRSLSSWEWGEFGREIDRLEAILRDMDETVPRD
jgi:hypothetical protein